VKVTETGVAFHPWKRWRGIAICVDPTPFVVWAGNDPCFPGKVCWWRLALVLMRHCDTDGGYRQGIVIGYM